jgi:hypothetical protein
MRSKRSTASSPASTLGPRAYAEDSSPAGQQHRLMKKKAVSLTVAALWGGGAEHHACGWLGIGTRTVTDPQMAWLPFKTGSFAWCMCGHCMAACSAPVPSQWVYVSTHVKYGFLQEWDPLACLLAVWWLMGWWHMNMSACIGRRFTRPIPHALSVAPHC